MFQHPIKDWSLRRLLNSTRVTNYPGTNSDGSNNDGSNSDGTNSDGTNSDGVYTQQEQAIIALQCSIYNPALPAQWMQYIIFFIIFLWLKDLLILRSLLDSTTIELKSTLNIVPTEWSEPWACFLNTEDEAKTANELLRGFSRSYSREPKRRVSAM
jgi:hypothetical protein